jgi:Rhodopirellula transposase DDE domain
VDTKKKELLGNFAHAGATWRQEADAVNAHDFLTDAQYRGVPYLSEVGFLSCQTHLGSSSQCVRWLRLRPGLRFKAALREAALIE